MTQGLNLSVKTMTFRAFSRFYTQVLLFGSMNVE